MALTTSFSFTLVEYHCSANCRERAKGTTLWFQLGISTYQVRAYGTSTIFHSGSEWLRTFEIVDTPNGLVYTPHMIPFRDADRDISPNDYGPPQDLFRVRDAYRATYGKDYDGSMEGELGWVQFCEDEERRLKLQRETEIIKRLDAMQRQADLNKPF